MDTPSIQSLPSIGRTTARSQEPNTEVRRPSFVELILGTIGSVVVSTANASEFTPVAAPDVYAFHVNWSLEGIASLNENILKIDTLLPEWVHLADQEGAIGLDIPNSFATWLADTRLENPDLRIVPVLTDLHEGTFHPDRVQAVLSNPVARQALVENISAFIADYDLDGIAIRLSSTETTPTAQLTQLLGELRANFTPDQRPVYAVLPMAAGLRHAEAVTRSADGVIVEGWGETVSGATPGPLASQNWFETMAADWQSRVPADQLVFALRNIAYDWGNGPVAQRISTLEALNRARMAGQAVTFDSEALNSQFSYTDPEGTAHEVWMLDAVSAYNQLQAVMRTPPRGIALSRLGTEDSSIWALLESPSQNHPDMLSVLDYSAQLTRHGTGEIIKVTQQPQTGSRSVTLGADGKIIDSAITVFPRSFEIAHWGGNDPNLIALTFDDGPDPIYTAQVLEVLARYDVPATFFATGAQMMRHPEIVRRIVDAGHEMGNHTYSHTNIANMNRELLRIDLNATQRVFESITGRNLVFFRAPYTVDANPEIASQIAPLSTVGELGYVTVNMNIDPKDWWSPNAERIASTTIRQVESGLGNIVLLHDAGGNRTETIAALPRIIEQLSAKGYRFVPVSELVGLTTDDVMPFSTREAGISRHFEGVGIALLRGVEITLVTLFFAAIALGITRSLLLIVLAGLRRRPASIGRPVSRGPKVAIIVPAYNEEKVIAKTIRSLLATTYHNYEILIVDDGSRDSTFAICEAEFGDHPRIRVLTKPNGGKAAALNFGFALTDAEIVVALDADTIFLPQTIGWLAARFSDEKVAAVAGNAKVGNRINLLTCWQATEYITSQNLDRRAFELLNCVTVVPGAVGAWRRSAVMAAGGYTHDTLAEDADLTLRLLRAGHRVVYEERAIALTEAPETSRQLFRQRFRWMFGMLQVAFKHKGALKMQDSKAVGLVALPHLFVFQILFPLVAPIADFVALLILGDLALKVFTQSSLLGVEQTLMFLGLFFAFILLDMLSAVLAFWHEKDEDWRLILWLPLQRFYYRQLLYLVAIKAALTAIRGSMVGWGNLARTASVKLDAANSTR